jgi:hypothetical protein
MKYSEAGLLMGLICLITVHAHSVARGQGEGETKSSNLVIRVVSEADNATVPGAKIVITNSNDLERHGTTDPNGKATFSKLPRGRITIHVVATGFDPAKKAATLEAADENISVQMRKSKILPDQP